MHGSAREARIIGVKIYSVHGIDAKKSVSRWVIDLCGKSRRIRICVPIAVSRIVARLQRPPRFHRSLFLPQVTLCARNTDRQSNEAPSECPRSALLLVWRQECSRSVDGQRYLVAQRGGYSCARRCAARPLRRRAIYLPVRAVDICGIEFRTFATTTTVRLLAERRGRVAAVGRRSVRKSICKASPVVRVIRRWILYKGVVGRSAPWSRGRARQPCEGADTRGSNR